VLQAFRPWMELLAFALDLTLPASLWPWGLRSAHSLTEITTRNLRADKARQVRKAHSITLIYEPIVHKDIGS
jgi:hypothetical protein